MTQWSLYGEHLAALAVAYVQKNGDFPRNKGPDSVQRMYVQPNHCNSELRNDRH